MFPSIRNTSKEIVVDIKGTTPVYQKCCRNNKNIPFKCLLSKEKERKMKYLKNLNKEEYLR